MADINYAVNVNVNGGGIVQNFNANGITSDFATAGMMAVTLVLGTATTQITTTGAAILGLCFAKAMHTTVAQTVSFGRLEGTTLHSTVRLKAGEASLLRLAPGNYGAVSSAASGKLLLTVLEE